MKETLLLKKKKSLDGATYPSPGPVQGSAP